MAPRRRLAAFCTLWVLLPVAAGGEKTAPPLPLAGPVGDLVDEYRAASGADVAVHVVRMTDGKALCDIRSGELLTPASNQKILTSAVALKRLGRDFRFRTRLVMIGKDLVVVGDGDPTTGDARLAAAREETIYAAFDRWAAALKKKGVSRIAGDLVVRAGIFQPPHYHPDWPAGQRSRWYSAPVAGVNFADNCIDVGFTVSGKEVRAVVSPRSRFLAVESHVRLGKRHLWTGRFDEVGRRLTLSGTVTRATASPLPVAAPSPPMLFGCVLADVLARAGIALDGAIVVSTDPPAGGEKDAQPVAVETMELGAVLYRANKQSLNMMAECLFLRSAAADGKPATWRKAADAARRVLVSDYGLAGDSFSVADGSGYSRNNRVSPAALTALLRALAGEPHFFRSLPVSGEDGSLRNRLRGPVCRGRIRAKTGYIARVSALSGYILDRRGKAAMAFSILLNGSTRGKGYSAHRLQEAICQALIGALDAPATTAPATTPPARRLSPRSGP